MEFKATFDQKTSVISAIIMMSLLAIAYFVPRSLTQEGEVNQAIIFGIPLLIIATIIGAYYFSIQSYTVDNQTIIINRPFDKVRIVRANIKNMSQLDSTSMKGNIRKFGSGGLFGYYGSWYNPNIGNFSLYATQLDNYILIETHSGKKIILTPDDIEGMFDCLKSV